MNLITLDFETYFADDYTLSGMTTEAYVRDPRFKVHMVGFRGGMYVSLGNVLPAHEAFNDTLFWNSKALLCHHAHFDGLILSHHYGIIPAFWFDTLSMARLVFPHAKSHSLGALAEMLGIGKKNIDYVSFKNIRDLPPGLYGRIAEGCANDVEMTYAVYKAMLPYVPTEELRVIDLTVRMFTEPALQLDKPRMEAYLEKTRNDKEAILTQLGVTKADLQSSAKFCQLLENLGITVPTKCSPSQPGKLIPAISKTDEAMKELCKHDNETVQLLCTARLGQKSTIGETRASRLLTMVGRGALCVYLKYWGAHTGRWSGGDAVNWQNFPRGGEHRLSVTAPTGYQLCVIDLAQIEFRMLAWLATDHRSLAALREGKDVYCDEATLFYGREITKADKAERQLFKAVILASGYGMGAVKFASVLKQQGLPDEHAAALNKHYRKTHPDVTKLWRYADKVLDALYAGGADFVWGPMRVRGRHVVMPNGAFLDYSNVVVEDGGYAVTKRHGTTKIYGAKLVENVVQALSRIVLSQAMLKIAERYKIVLTCHDEVVYLAQTEDAPEALAYGLSVMKSTPGWCAGIPLDAEGGYAERYSK